MTAGFWSGLFATGRPIVGLSPMDGVTDVAMRYMTARYGTAKYQAPKSKLQTKGTEILNSNDDIGGVDLLFTEFVSVDALKHAKEERSVSRVMRAFLRAKDIGELEQKPFEIAQVFGHTPELFYQAAVIIATLGFDGMDINMGCPAHKVEEQGSGAGLIRTPKVALSIMAQAKQAMEDFSQGRVSVDELEISQATKDWVKLHATGVKQKGVLPVSVKTRIGVDKVEVDEWMATLMEGKPANISLHGRTLRQLYQGSADWEAIGRATAVVHKLGGHILGNGDISNLEDAKAKIKQYGVDGVLIGRSAEGNPGIFNSQITNDKFSNEEPSMEQRLAWMIEHAKKFEEVFKPVYPPSLDELRKGTRQEQWFLPVRKHLAWYCKGFPQASEIRGKLVQANGCEEVEEILAGIV